MGERKQGLQVPYMVCSQNGSKASKPEVFTRDGMSSSTAPPAQAFNGGQQQQCNKITLSTQTTQKLSEKDTNSSSNTTVYVNHYYNVKLQHFKHQNPPQPQPFKPPQYTTSDWPTLHAWDNSTQQTLRLQYQYYYYQLHLCSPSSHSTLSHSHQTATSQRSDFHARNGHNHP